MITLRDLKVSVEHAFVGRECPSLITDRRYPCDAYRFEGQVWRTLTWEDWQSFPEAVFEFTPNAFAYFLPSIIFLSASRPLDWLRVADGVIGILDRSPVPEYWDDFMRDRFLILSKTECSSLIEWLSILDAASIYERHALGRAFDTIALIQETSGAPSIK